MALELYLVNIKSWFYINFTAKPGVLYVVNDNFLTIKNIKVRMTNTAHKCKTRYILPQSMACMQQFKNWHNKDNTHRFN